MLCHHIILALIIQNRVKAGWSLVRSCAGRLALESRSRLVHLRSAFTAIIVIMSFSFLAFICYGPLLKAASSIREHFQAAAAVQATSKADALGPEKRKDAPSVLGRLSLKKDQNLWRVFQDIYASHDPDMFRKFVEANLTASSVPSFISDPEMFREFVKANPRIDNIQMVSIGKVIILPALPAPEDGIQKKTLIQRARAKTLTKAYHLFRAHAGRRPELMLFPYWNQREGMVFALMLKKQFENREAALKALKHVTPLIHGKARVLDTWDDDTVFYHNLEDRS
jgi:hypothetical protein